MLQACVCAWASMPNYHYANRDAWLEYLSLDVQQNLVLVQVLEVRVIDLQEIVNENYEECVEGGYADCLLDDELGQALRLGDFVEEEELAEKADILRGFVRFLVLQFLVLVRPDTGFLPLLAGLAFLDLVFGENILCGDF